jgi:light-regulated signal transduction histidine kinase (bacteriophytochrome)
VEQFAYMASHELQGPLAAAAGYLDLLAGQSRVKLEPAAARLVLLAHEGVTRMQRLVDNLLTYARVASIPPLVEWLDSESVLDMALANLGGAIATSRAHVTYGPLPRIKMDELDLLLLFQNLVSNGVKFGGPRPPRVHVSAGDENGTWRFWIRDNGIGFDPRMADKLFGVFERQPNGAGRPGNGMGLAICQRIVQRYGGEIRADSEPGRGSTFFFSIPKLSQHNLH